MATGEKRTDTIRVLHVDDHVDFAEMATTFLERENDRFDTEIGASASDGLDRLADSSFDCVLSDYDMPTQDGIEFLRTVRQKYPELPFILYTGEGSEAVASEAISAGVTDYLQKSSGTEQCELLAHRITDAVEQSQAEQQAQEEQRRFRTLFERLSQPTVEVQYKNDEPIVTQVNSAFEDVFGYTADTVVGESLDACIVPEDRISDAAAINQHVQAGGRLESREVIRQTTDGPRRFFLENAVYDDCSGGFFIYTDITDQHDRRQRLEQIETFFQHAQDHLFLINVDESFRIERLNPAWEDTPGISVAESCGQTIQDVLGETQAQKVEQKYRKCVEQRETLEYEEEIQFGDDPARWETRIAPVVIDGVVEYIAGASRDITEIRAQKQQLAELKQQYQTLAENFPDGAVYLIDDNFEYVRACGEELERVGLSPADIEGHTPHEVFPDELADKACKHYKQAFDGIATTLEQEYRGEHYRIRVTPVKPDGTEMTHVMAVAQNITEHVEDRRELQRQNEQLDEFASVVSHDLRNPLSVAKGYLELLREDCDNDRTRKIASALTRMDELIDDLLQLARIGEQVKNPESVNLAELSQSCWQNVETTNATIHLNIDATVQADRGRLAQVFENLMRNAIEHADQDQGKNETEDEDEDEDVTITIGELADGFYVADDGSGIPVDERDDVFEAGYTTTEQGTGFGLSIVKQIIEAHGWEISLTGSPEDGARFEVTDIELNRRYIES